MKTTQETDNYLKGLRPDEFGKYLTGDYSADYRDLADYLNRYIAARGLAVPAIVEHSLLSRNYAYQILNGTRKNPSRERLIPLCLAMRMSLEDTNRALKLSKAGELYSRIPRDAAIIVCINNGIFDVMQVNDYLVRNGFEALEGTVEN